MVSKFDACRIYHQDGEARDVFLKIKFVANSLLADLLKSDFEMSTFKDLKTPSSAGNLFSGR